MRCLLSDISIWPGDCYPIGIILKRVQSERFSYDENDAFVQQ